ncbi:hypothetical protein [Peterkaempfera bronchialis]|uniref:Secreted protein n=1 Tax=Peterkaempfera bronchialis TaxID=2126346 RepID=A0A345SUW6_9ACTN|nr:hypothetical protein [Peterkaempfera bronchialis]AXI77521.1 hypothetical protein C7M71_008770 [Peterkaempfera bronchialis]
MEAVGIVVGIVALFVLGLIALMVVAAVKAGKAVSRKVEQHGTQARRAVEDATLRARKYTQTGPQGRIAALRLEVRDSLAGTRRVLESGVTGDPQLAEALHLLAQLDEHAQALDGELRLLERETGTQRLDAKLPELRERADRITHAAESLRWAAQDRAQHFSDSELIRLSRECETEAGALRHWTPTAAGAAGAAAAGGAADGASAGSGAEEQRRQRRGLAAGRGVSAAEALGLGDPRLRLADRLRKPRPDPGTPTAR